MDPRSPNVTDAVRALLLDETLAEVIRVFRDEGVGCVLLKGPSIARWLYDDQGERSYVDIDLMVAAPDAHRAETVLGRLGFVRRGFESMPGERPRPASALRRADGVAVDLHTTFLGIGVPADQLWDEVSRHLVTMPIAGEPVPVLDPCARAVVLALHAAKDGGRAPKVREDVRRGAERLPENLWRDAADLAERWDASAAFAAGLRRTTEGAALAERLGLSEAMTAEVALRTTSPPPLAVGLDWLLRGEEHRSLRLIARKVFPPKDYIRAWKPVARRGRFGLAVAYAWRPLWLAWKAVPASIAVVRARRTIRRAS